jgi:acyl carrier protein
MEKDQILSELKPIFREVFDNAHIEINPASSANDVDGWDSLSHIELIIAIEKHFNVRFKSADLETLLNVDDLSRMIQSKLGVN